MFRTSTRVVMSCLVCAALELSLSPHAPAAEPAPAKTAWTVDDVVMQERATSWTISDDGRLALWLKQTPDRERDGNVAQLMLTDLESGEHRSLTVGNAGLSAPAFRPGGEAISFLSSRKPPAGVELPKEKEAGPQLWTLDLRGGEAQVAVKVPFGIGGYAWIDEQTLILTTRERRSRRELIDTDAKDDTRVVEATDLFEDRGRQLFRYDLMQQKLTRLNADNGPVATFAPSRDGRYVVALHDQSPSYVAEGDVPPKCVVHDLQESTSREVFADRKNKPRRLVWRPDSNGFYALYPVSTVDGEDSGAIWIVKEVTVPSLEVHDVDPDWERGLTFLLVATRDGFIAGLADGVRPGLAHFRREVGGYRREMITHDQPGAIFSLLKARDADRTLFITGAASDPDRVVAARLAGSELQEAREVYRPNQGFSDKPIAKTRTIRFTGALDEEVEAIVYEPHDYEEGQQRPLVVITHGGPHGADQDRFRESWASSPNLYAQRGAFVLKVNYHGSSSYGLEFGESIKGRYYELEVKDIFAGIQTLIDDGLVDRERMGLVGWSNGAILSIAALTLDELYAPGYGFQFKACAPGAGDVNWSSDYGNCAFGPVFDDFYLGGPPWELPEVYQKKSPLFYVDRVTTPTIIFFGTEDRAVPTEQGWQWYRALHMTKKAPVRFLLFPGEPHGLIKLSHQRRKLKEELAWFDRHLFGKQEESESPVKEGSPLDVALKMRTLPMRDGAFGVVTAGKLTPEIVKFGDIHIGRFEVTRAQWRAFDASTTLEPGTENHPITDVDPKRVTAYLEWLSRTTGSPWRLPSKSEFDKLRKAAGGNENTLDWWAGYKPAPDDARVLREQLLQMPLSKVLLPVGSRLPGVLRNGENRTQLFDVGGNAAEWVTTDDGVQPMGGCAILESDDRAGDREPPPQFIGFRVVQGEATDPDASE